MSKCTVREIEIEDYENIINYFHDSSAEYMESLGADPAKLPSKKDWLETLKTNHEKPNQQKKIYYLIWELDGKAIGHCDIKKITYGKYAYLHIHIWDEGLRKQGHGTALIRRSIPMLFTNFEIKKIYCETYSKNKAPNKALPTAGFEFLDSYKTKPGRINFTQDVNRYIFIKAQLKKLLKSLENEGVEIPKVKKVEKTETVENTEAVENIESSETTETT